MSKYTVVYWSMTGNTASMADAIASELTSQGHEVDLKEVADATEEDALNNDILILGCPAMGDEVLDESEFQPYVDSIVGQLAGHKVALFGAYGWGEGQWMHDFEALIRQSGAELLGEGFIRNDDFTDGIEAWVNTIL